MAGLPNATSLPPKPPMGDMDERKIRRLDLNRKAAQRSRLKKHEHVLHLENKVKELKEHKKLLSAQVDRFNFKLMMLKIEVNSARERLAILTRASVLRDGKHYANLCQDLEFKGRDCPTDATHHLLATAEP
ncbi:hypothetical protein Sjap_005611 [Stephania japonica]|uniref:BZIP domain-containing protein n=1 Tax=Stephania japonica TaxID=461633 RepID=A0AAP0K4E9_9MAGN